MRKGIIIFNIVVKITAFGWGGFKILVYGFRYVFIGIHIARTEYDFQRGRTVIIIKEFDDG